MRRADRAKADVLTAFKKQLRLIEILKRQRVHVGVQRHTVARRCRPAARARHDAPPQPFVPCVPCPPRRAQMEAARMLEFTQEEFAKMMEAGT